ncbi:MAG: CinA family protein [Christensenellaceae bacterium]|nr:CinA family protein [Christensenellaceae bacterium]
MQCCATENEIRRRIEECTGVESYEIVGNDWDYTVVFEEVDDYTASCILNTISDIMYGQGELSLAETFVNKAIEKGVCVSVAESCTGGLLASSIIDVAGASQMFQEGLVTYTDIAKMERLDVNSETLLTYGAVSEEAAIEMAEGLFMSAPNIKVGISTTGIAGPGGGSLEKPVGTVYIAVVGTGNAEVYKNLYKGDRFTIRNKTKNCALFYALKYINKYY